jgi:predicted protein tyrosine phosphatase
VVIKTIEEKDNLIILNNKHNFLKNNRFKIIENKPMILILSKEEFAHVLLNRVINDSNVEEKDELAFISINDSTRCESYFKVDHSNVLKLYFDDIVEEIEPFKLFSDEDALKTIEFIKKHIDKRFIVHCQAGISRSGAIGTFINEKISYLSPEDFKAKNPYISPNQYVYNKLNKLWKDE